MVPHRGLLWLVRNQPTGGGGGDEEEEDGEEGGAGYPPEPPPNPWSDSASVVSDDAELPIARAAMANSRPGLTPSQWESGGGSKKKKRTGEGKGQAKRTLYSQDPFTPAEMCTVVA